MRWKFAAVAFAVTAAACSWGAMAAKPAHAQVIAFYDFTGSPGNQASEAPDSVAAGATATDLTRGSGLGANAGTNSINSNNWTTAAAPDANDYYAFSVTPTAGNQLSLSSLTFTDRRSGTGPQNFDLRASTNGFASSTLITSFTGSGTADNARNFDLTSFALLQNTTSTVEFRLFGYNATGTGGTYRLNSPTAGTGLTLNGSVLLVGGAVAPEPGALALALSGLAPVGMIAAARRRRHHCRK